MNISLERSVKAMSTTKSKDEQEFIDNSIKYLQRKRQKEESEKKVS